MRKMALLPIAAAGSFLLSGCAAGMGGNPMADILGSVLNGGAGAQASGGTFERAAVNACGQQASQYGRVSITNVEQRSADTIRVDGRIEADNRGSGQFTCTFRSDGRIVDFRTA
jgi:hypothetical protein